MSEPNTKAVTFRETSGAVTVTLEKTLPAINFEFHFDEAGELVIDQCEGIDVEEGLAMLPMWALEKMRERAVRK